MQSDFILSGVQLEAVHENAVYSVYPFEVIWWRFLSLYGLLKGKMVYLSNYSKS